MAPSTIDPAVYCTGKATGVLRQDADKGTFSPTLEGPKEGT